MKFFSTIMTRIMIPIALISLLVISRCDPTVAAGLTLDLIRHDSPRSPFFKSSSTTSRRLDESLTASVRRGRYLSTLISPQLPGPEPEPEPDIKNYEGEYFMEYSLGTPPVVSRGVLDTASDLTWTQCTHCRVCIHQVLAVFNPEASSTYRQITCDAPECTEDVTNYCSRFGNHCRYSLKCRGRTYGSGALATDTFTFHPNVSIPGIQFGCGSINTLPFIAGESGVVGFGRGKSSFIRQLEPIAHGRFSYCFVPTTDNTSAQTSKMHLGDPAVVSGPGAVTTPLVVERGFERFYFVTLEGITVGKKKLEPPRNPNTGLLEGNTVVDTAVIPMMLPAPLYEEFVNGLKDWLKLKNVEEVRDPKGVFKLCHPYEEDLDGMDIIFHFRGADVKLAWENIFGRVSEFLACLMLVENAMPVFGSLAQMNFLVGYDLHNNTITFMPTDCTKQ